MTIEITVFVSNVYVCRKQTEFVKKITSGRILKKKRYVKLQNVF